MTCKCRTIILQKIEHAKACFRVNGRLEILAEINLYAELLKEITEANEDH